MSECLRSAGLRVLHWKLRLLKTELRFLEIEKSQLQSQAEALKLAERIYAKLDEIRRTKQAILRKIEQLEAYKRE